jgi:hypothetical protein
MFSILVGVLGVRTGVAGACRGRGRGLDARCVVDATGGCGWWWLMVVVVSQMPSDYAMAILLVKNFS